jgi:hypothetical protein
MSEIGCSRKEKITAVKIFMELHSIDDIASFMVNLNDANDVLIEQRSKARAERDEWKADAEKLASLVEDERNAYDLMGRDGVTGITDEGYLKLERALMDHNSLVYKEENKK